MNYIYTQNPVDSAADTLTATLRQRLKNGERVLWLLSGGSSLDIATKVSQNLADLELSKLSVSLTDERYGPIGHSDENWQMLLDHGLNLPGADLYRPLNGLDRKHAAIDFNDWLSNKLANSDYRIGIFGMGSDGHTSGIKPGSPAVESSDLVTEFTGDDFERITTTPAAISQLDEAVVQISGQNKAEQLNRLLDKDLAISVQPAQALKTIPLVNIYTDIKL